MTASTADLIERALADLPATIRARRGPLSYRQAANESGISFNTICRAEKGGGVDAATLIALVRWAESPSTSAPTSTLGAGQQTSRGAGRSDQ